MSCQKLAGEDLRADMNFELADLRTSTVINMEVALIEFYFC